MWAVIKIKKNNLSTIKKEFFIKLGKDVKFFIPKIKINIFNKS